MRNPRLRQEPRVELRCRTRPAIDRGPSTMQHRTKDSTPTPLRIHAPCTKKWEELSGEGCKRFCSACALHVHDASRMKESEARALVESATSRVCMRLQFDANGTPIFSDSRKT